MKFTQKFANEKLAKSAAGAMKAVCYFVIGFYVLCFALGLLGRQTFVLHTKTGSYGRAIYAEEVHSAHSRNMTVSMGDDIHVWTDDNDQIEPTVHIGLTLMYAVHVLPMAFAFWLLSRIFSNIQQGQIFTEQNATYLLGYGLLQIFATVFVPVIKGLICWLVNLVSDGQLSISTGQAMFKTLVPGIGFLVAAYIIHYGVYLQDEVDHTL